MSHQEMPRPGPRVGNGSTHLIGGRWTHAESALDSLRDAVLCTDVAGRVTYLNRTAETMTGWSRAAAVGRPLRDVFHRDGHGITVEDSASPIRDGNGLVVGAVVVFRDIGAALKGSRGARRSRPLTGWTEATSRSA